MAICADMAAAEATLGTVHFKKVARRPTRGAARRATHIRALDQEQAERLRLLPLASSAMGVAAVVGNRLVDGATPTLVASSAQSRADVAAVLVAAVLGLTGLQWLSLKPKAPTVVDLDGVSVDYLGDDTKNTPAEREIRAMWDAVRAATRTDMMVVFWRGQCIAHLGYKRRNFTDRAQIGSLCRDSQERNVPRSLANLALFPGRFEFLAYLPSNTQSVHVQPLHPDGVVVLGTATQRSFTILDQAWIGTWCDKLCVALEDGAGTPSPE